MLNKDRVAILDDDDDVLEALVFQLSTAGFNVTAEGSPYELLSAANARDRMHCR